MIMLFGKWTNLKIKTKIKNGTIQASQQEEEIGEIKKADQMGAFLDGAKDIRQDKKSASRKAH